MPIFEFKCSKCGKKFEKIIFKPLSEVEIRCPYCQGVEVEKLISVLGSVGEAKNSSLSNNCSPGCCSCNSKNN